MDETLRPYRRPEAIDVIEHLGRPLSFTVNLITRIRQKDVPLAEVDDLEDAKVSEYFMDLGLVRGELDDILKDAENLRSRHKFYQDLQDKLFRLVDEDLLVASPSSYLKINPQLSVKETLQMPEPIDQKQADWLDRVKDSDLFVKLVWERTIDVK